MPNKLDLVHLSIEAQVNELRILFYPFAQLMHRALKYKKNQNCKQIEAKVQRQQRKHNRPAPARSWTYNLVCFQQRNALKKVSKVIGTKVGIIEPDKECSRNRRKPQATYTVQCSQNQITRIEKNQQRKQRKITEQIRAR